jgi:hypothetical protein
LKARGHRVSAKLAITEIGQPLVQVIILVAQMNLSVITVSDSADSYGAVTTRS